MTTVLMTADTVGGVWTYALDLADALAAYDVVVHLATMGPRATPVQRQAVDRSAVAAVHESDFALEWMPEPWRDVDTAREWLLQLADDVGADAVHLNGYAHAALEWRIPTVVVAHSDVISWWSAVHGVPAPAEWSTYRERVAAGLRAADAVVTPTAAVADDLRRHYAFDDAVVVPNFRRRSAQQAMAKEPLVAAAGRAWDEAKNLAAVQRVAAELPWPVEIADGSLSAAEVAALLRRAAVFVAPARYEPFGLGALEAAHAGCALVLGDIPSLREVWGDAALYVHPCDDDGLVQAVRRLAGDDVRRARLAASARERAATYTAERTARGYLDVYARLPVRTR